MTTRRFGIPASTAREQAQKHQEVFPLETFEQPPSPPGGPPFHATSESLGVREPKGPRTFYVIGDSGGVRDPDPQNAVTAVMEGDSAPDFVYHVGDAGYFNGTMESYVSQFFEAYAHLNVPIVGIPGNHDGDPLPGQQSLEAWMKVFCSTEASLLPGTEEYGRDAETQPNCYWTMLDPAVTIVGLYSNVPSGGVIKPDQAGWLEAEVAAAPTDRPLVVTLHHPPYSCDAHHGGSARMGTILDTAFAAAGRWPQLVISGHVHNYQRFTRQVGAGEVTYIVGGGSGYHNLHRMARGARPGLQATADTVLDAFVDDRWGFLILDVDGMTIKGEYVAVAKDGSSTAADSF